ncbi:MAG: GntR family transcriptional regulator [Clostridiales bacterium]|nr:GntR family transcriptional regulator [Clostridiales bacterium]
MEIQIDFDSEEALYIQLRNQIIYGIATRQYQEGDSLPSVRSLAETIGINMHTVNKAYAVLRQEGLLRLGRRTGAVIAVDIDKLKAKEEMRDQLRLTIARGFCKGVSREEIHQLVDEIYSDYE